MEMPDTDVVLAYLRSSLFQSETSILWSMHMQGWQMGEKKKRNDD